MTLNTISILDGNEFVVSSRQGDLEATPTENHGLFLDDTRFLSRWVLTINGLRPILLSIDDTSCIQHFLALATGAVYIDSHLTVIRQRSVGGGLHEVISLANHGKEAIDLEVRIEVAADFADLFEVKDKLTKKGELYRHVGPGDRLTLGYRREQYRRETQVTSSVPAEISEDDITYKVRLEPTGSDLAAEWTTRLDVLAVKDPDRASLAPSAPSAGEVLRADLASDLKRWMDDAPKVVL